VAQSACVDLLDVIEYCLSLPGAEETQPFGPDVLVYKVGGRMFAATRPEMYPPRVNLKCDPERAIELREEYVSITPGWHMNKVHWNTVVLDGSVPSRLVRELVHHSYALVADQGSARGKGRTARPRRSAERPESVTSGRRRRSA
jgi:predicted DNA-binding protein (MmcQ/YjbR family)